MWSEQWMAMVPERRTRIDNIAQRKEKKMGQIRSGDENKQFGTFIHLRLFYMFITSFPSTPVIIWLRNRMTTNVFGIFHCSTEPTPLLSFISISCKYSIEPILVCCLIILSSATTDVALNDNGTNGRRKNTGKGQAPPSMLICIRIVLKALSGPHIIYEFLWLTFIWIKSFHGNSIVSLFLPLRSILIFVLFNCSPLLKWLMKAIRNVDKFSPELICLDCALIYGATHTRRRASGSKESSSFSLILYILFLAFICSPL